MYLKQLVLKGFKSFADRSVLTFEPGISAVVGPNGSGKSNISDAVLWVLGERNAKNLRGQSMEDVIFAGSSARKSVSVAEVDLVLDNSDATLPIEYSEVVITRRMYRSGESEYLINGAVSRRMDVLDILHDTGLGTGTHSIISQGSLDSILQSKPEDRRALVEEAAGVLKHKQRKAKSARKLEQMDNHLARVKDVVGEVERQLGPLERKAKRAMAYQDLASELAAIDLELAVDTLRTLQGRWNDAQKLEGDLTEKLETARQTVVASEAAVEALQGKIHADGLDAGELAKKYRAAQSALERFDSNVLLLHEKRRSAAQRAGEIEVSLEENRARMGAARAELARAEGQFAESKAEKKAADLAFSQASAEKERLEKELRSLADALGRSRNAQRRLRTEIEAVGKRRAETNETLANSVAHERLISSHKKEIESQLERAREALDGARKETEAADARLEGLLKKEADCREKVTASMSESEAARSELDEVRGEKADVEAEIRALEELERLRVSSNAALSWVISRKDELDAGIEPLLHAVCAPSELEPLLERLLGRDLESLIVRDFDAACDVAEAVRDSGLPGEAIVVPARSDRPSAARGADVEGAERLVDSLEFDPSNAAAVESLLGDVYLCGSVSEALERCSRASSEARFATKDGFVAWGDGRISVGRDERSEEDGALAKHRRLEALRADLEALSARLEAAEARLREAEAAQRRAQADGLAASQECAKARGALDAAKQSERAAESSLSSLQREMDDLERQRAEAQAALEKARPSVAELDARLERLNGDLEAAIEETRRRQRETDPLQEESRQVGERLSEAKLKVATLAERNVYSERIVLARRQEIESIEARDAKSRKSLDVQRLVEKRVEPLLACFDALASSAKAQTDRLERETLRAQDASSALHAQVNEARETARRAHDALDAVNAQLSAAKVEKGRLEVQVETAIDAIVKDCGASLETALELPPLEDRPLREEEAEKLRRRISAMGTINPDAAKDYEEVRKRYDYLAAQLSDLEAARRSLAKIVKVIDARMKDDFVRTFEQVNANFQQIFSVLFPGGSANLSLVDPDDVENSGIEVTAQPRGKRITKMMLMSGGEKSLTAIALLFAAYRIRSTPFYILDEVEAALDDSNLRRLVAYLDSLRDDTQLIMITHQRRTMEMADALFGVSMQADGVTKVISQKLDRALALAEG